MRNRIIGGIGVLWGGSVIIYGLTKGGAQGSGAYATGQMIGTIQGGLLFAVGLYYLIKGGSGEKKSPRD